MPYVLIIHEVAAYAAWKAVFDQAAPLRKAAGELNFQVLAGSTEPNRIVHFSRWTSLAAARDFFQSGAVEAIRRRAGVIAPDFLYLEELDAGVL